MTTEEAVAKDFVCTGFCVLKGGDKGVVIRIIEPEGLGAEMVFKAKGMRHLICGQVYTGARFEGSSVLGLNRAKWVKPWHNKDDQIAWAASQAAAEVELAHTKRMKNATKEGDELEKAMIPLRRIYQKYSDAYDIANMRSFELAVIATLKLKLRSYEK